LNHGLSIARSVWRAPLLYGQLRARLAALRTLRRSVAAPERWFDVSLGEFETFLRDYPRPLAARPPLDRPATRREWVDPTLGNWPGSAVARCRKQRHCAGYQIRLF